MNHVVFPMVANHVGSVVGAKMEAGLLKYCYVPRTMIFTCIALSDIYVCILLVVMLL
ncbi:hypothetical protein HanLR1_Chr17g0655701 [Helianthus annuus]|nr:hypothetical protein HanLR1_Chr17g0655701 [Helianthus annuus]